MRTLWLLTILFLPALLINAQNIKDRSGFTYGGGFGGAVASGKNALFYNGAPETQNAVVNVIGNEYYKEIIYEILKDNIKSISYPSKMRYNPAVSLHGYLGYVIANKNSVFGQLTYSSYSTEGIFSVELASLNTESKVDNNKYYEGGIKASESRVDIEFGYHISIGEYDGKKIPFVEILGNINSVTVKKHDMQLGSFTSSLIHVNANNYYTNQDQGGMGYGFGFAVGMEFSYKTRMYYTLGVKATLKTIHLLENPSLTPHGELFFRILL